MAVGDKVTIVTMVTMVTKPHKKVFTKPIKVSEEDYMFLVQLKQAKVFKAHSLAGTLSQFIKQNKKDYENILGRIHNREES